MSVAQILFVTGKGGVGKTTVAAAAATGFAGAGQRVLLVELNADRGLARLFGRDALASEPESLAPRLDGVRIDEKLLLEDYFTRLLRLKFLTRRLFASVTFNAIATAAPGVTEFLILEHLLQWIEAGALRRRKYDSVVIDGPATGHALRLLRAPGQLVSMVGGGPIGGTAARLAQLLADHHHFRVLLVAIPDEMAVNETIEARADFADTLGLRVARPVLNRVFPRRFSTPDAEKIARLSSKQRLDPLLAAARLEISARHDAERHVGRLRRAFGAAPIVLRQVCSQNLGPVDVDLAAQALLHGLEGKRR